MLACFVHPASTLLAKNAVDLFAHGYSPVKAGLLPLFLLLVLALDRSKLPAPPSVVFPLFLVNAGLAHLLAVLEQVWFTRQFHLEIWEPAMVLKDGYFTVTGMTHIHASKVLLSPLFGEVRDVTDAGYPLNLVFGAVLARLHLLLFLFLLILALLGSVRAYRTLTPGKATSLSLIIFAISKTALDGGPFSSEFLSALVVLVWLHLGYRKAFGMLVVIALHLWLVELTPWVMLVWGYPSNILALSLPALWEKIPARANRWPLWGLMGTALFFSPLAVGAFWPSFDEQPYGLNLLRYGLTELPPGTRLWMLTSERPRTSSLLDVRRTASVGPYTQIEGTVTKPTRVLDLCEEYRLAISRAPIVWSPQEFSFSAEVLALNEPRSSLEDSPLLVSRETLPAADGYSRVKFQLRPGANRSLAYALLGPQLMVVRRGGFLPGSTSRQGHPGSRTKSSP